MPRLRSAPPAKATKGFRAAKSPTACSPRVQAAAPSTLASSPSIVPRPARALPSPTLRPHPARNRRTVATARGDLQAAIDRVRQRCASTTWRLVVASNAPANTIGPCNSPFRQAGFETRLVHPSPPSNPPARRPRQQDRRHRPGRHLPRHPRTASDCWNRPGPDDYLTIQCSAAIAATWWTRNAMLQCQIREVLHAAMPGYARMLLPLWDDSPAPLIFARHTPPPTPCVEWASPVCDRSPTSRPALPC